MYSAFAPVTCYVNFEDYCPRAALGYQAITEFGRWDSFTALVGFNETVFASHKLDASRGRVAGKHHPD